MHVSVHCQQAEVRLKFKCHQTRKEPLLAIIWKCCVAAALVTIGIHYMSEGVAVIREAVSGKHQDGPHDTKK